MWTTAGIALIAAGVPFVAQLATPTNLACMQTAVEKRDNAVIAAFDAFSASMKSAFTARRDALKTAWGKENRSERRTALRTAWGTFRASRKLARETFRTARHNAWKTFRADAKACHGVHRGEEGANEASEIIGL